MFLLKHSTTEPLRSHKGGADKTAQMRRLVCAFGVRMQQSQVLSSYGPFNT